MDCLEEWRPCFRGFNKGLYVTAIIDVLVDTTPRVDNMTSHEMWAVMKNKYTSSMHQLKSINSLQGCLTRMYQSEILQRDRRYCKVSRCEMYAYSCRDARMIRSMLVLIELK